MACSCCGRCPPSSQPWCTTRGRAGGCSRGVSREHADDWWQAWYRSSSQRFVGADNTVGGHRHTGPKPTATAGGGSKRPPQGGTTHTTPEQNPTTETGEAGGGTASAHRRGAQHRRAGGPQGGTTPRGAPAHGLLTRVWKRPFATCILFLLSRPSSRKNNKSLKPPPQITQPPSHTYIRNHLLLLISTTTILLNLYIIKQVLA